jgi:pimeloyl-ACP methyl ester carboxylesterase
LASGLEEGGIEGFLDAAEDPALPEEWRESAREANRQRIEKHEHPEAVAQALRVTPQSRAFDGLGAIEELEVPALVVASRDEADPLHPFAIAREYVRRLPNAELAVEDEGESPLAWQGAQLSRTIGDFVERALAVKD